MLSSTITATATDARPIGRVPAEPPSGSCAPFPNRTTMPRTRRLLSGLFLLGQCCRVLGGGGQGPGPGEGKRGETGTDRRKGAVARRLLTAHDAVAPARSSSCVPSGGLFLRVEWGGCLELRALLSLSLSPAPLFLGFPLLFLFFPFLLFFFSFFFSFLFHQPRAYAKKIAERAL